MLEAIEELHMAAKAARLPPIEIAWREPLATNGEDTSLTERVARDIRRLEDISAIGTGPQPLALAATAPPPEPDAFLVEGFIRPGTTVMLTGPPSAAKSWASRQLALSCGAGLSTFLDRYSIPRPLSVLVVDEDNGEAEEYRREEQLLGHLELRRDWMTDVHRISLAGVMLDRPAWQSWLRSQIEALQVDLLILDPISEMHSGKELREDPAFRGLLGFLKRLKVDFARMATILVHHTRKPALADRTAARSVDDVRGQWGQTPDVVAMLWPLGERRSSWELHKRVPHSKLILEQAPSGALMTVADETTSRSTAMANDDRVLAAVGGGLTTFNEIRATLEMPKATLYRVIARLAGAGLITKRPPYTRLEDPE